MAYMKKELVHLYTGNGKGKTTAALGLLLRALGAGYKVYLFQFMKKGDSSELCVLKRLEGVELHTFGAKGFIKKGEKDENYWEMRESNRAGLKLILELFENFKYELRGRKILVVLDEICLLPFFEIASVEEIIEIIKKKPDNVELVLTGRNAPKELFTYCDYVSEVREVKHPFKKGVKARKGIES